MTRLVWGTPEQRRYETGVSQGVLFANGGDGVVWNGLKSVEESPLSRSFTSFYNDGTKYLDGVGGSDYQATITAFSAPDEFEGCLGYATTQPGFIITHQPRIRFGFSYRTEIAEAGYKIHLVYNATAIPSSKKYGTISATPSTADLVCVINAVPEMSSIFVPSAHFIVNSLDTSDVKMAAFEALIYGDSGSPSTLPDVADLIAFFA